MLEVLAGAGALTDLIATGARLVEPDARVVTGRLYAPPATGRRALRTCDPEPRAPSVRATARGALVGSAETLAYAVATGEVGDPRAFKRPVRVTVPRALPTDDVLVARKPERGDGGPRRACPRRAAQGGSRGVPRVAGCADARPRRGRRPGRAPRQQRAERHRRSRAATLDEVRDLAARAPEIAHSVRAVLAPFIPSALVSLLSAAGIAALRIDAAAAKKLEGQKTIALPAPSQWAEREATSVAVGSREAAS